MITLKDICKSYGTLQVLKGISLEIPERKLTAIVGASGAGKSTLLNIVGTLDRPDSGRVLYDGEDVFSFKDNRLSAFRNSNIGFVFQNHRLLPEFTLQENVAMPALIAGQSRVAAMSAAANLMDRLGLHDRLQHKPDQVSGGEAQRAAVARALVNKPRVVLADEPSGSLDSENRNVLQQLFFQLCADLGVTFLVVTHDENLASGAHKVVRMQDGRVIS